MSQAETGLTKELAAEFLGISRRQIDRYIEKGMPRVGAGRKVRFGPTAFAWHREYLAQEKGVGKEVGKLQEEMARKTQIEADRAQLKLLKEQGELVQVSTVRQKLEQINSIIKTKLLGLPTKMAPTLAMKPTNQIKAKMESQILEVLEELVAQGKR